MTDKTNKKNIFKKLLSLNYKETLYFVAKCLTITLEDGNRDEIELVLKSKYINWEAVVKVSTSHYVLPALYCNFQRSNFLHYLPDELIAYMQYITNLNRERNKQIITQARKLNTLLLKNNIKPIFLKGTANLFSGIYVDLAERMVGDIDFLFSKEDYPKAIKLLKKFNYSEVSKFDYYYPGAKHYGRLQKENNIAAVEIHSEMLGFEKYREEFNYSIVEKDLQIINQIRVLSYANKLNLSIISHQINDNGLYYKTIALRNAYDVFLLSKKTIAIDAVNKLQKLNYPLNCFLATCYEVFDKLDSLKYNNTKKTVSYLKIFNNQFANPVLTKKKHKIIQIYLFLKYRCEILINVITNKDSRIWFIKRITDINRYHKKIDKPGLKK